MSCGTPGGLDPRIEHMLDMNAVAAHWGDLPRVIGHLRSRLLDLEGTRAYAGPALAPQPPTGHASATSARRL